MDFADFFDEPAEELELQRPVCPRHFIELPVSGECEACL